MRYDKDKRAWWLSTQEVQDLNDKMARIREQCEILEWQLMFRTNEPGKSRKLN